MRPTVIFAVLFLVSLLVMGWLLWATAALRSEARTRFFEQYNQQQLILAQQAAKTIEGVFDTFRRNLELVGGLFAGQEVSAQAVEDVRGSLRRIYASLEDTPIIDLVVFDQEGTVVAIEPQSTHTVSL